MHSDVIEFFRQYVYYIWGVHLNLVWESSYCFQILMSVFAFHSCLKFIFFLNHYVMQCFPLHLENMLILLSSCTGMVATLTNESATSKAVYFAHCTSEMIYITHLLAEELKNWQAHFWLIRMLHCWREEMRGMVNGLQRGKLGKTWGTAYREKEWYRSKFNFELRQIFSFSLLFIARIYVS